LRREERGEGKDFLMGAQIGSRTEGMRKRWRIGAAIVAVGGWGRELEVSLEMPGFLD
jgi:hypothetical protein